MNEGGLSEISMKNKIFVRLLYSFILLSALSKISFASDIKEYQALVDKVKKRLVLSIDADSLDLKFNFNPKFYVEESPAISADTWVDAVKGEYSISIYTGMLQKIIEKNPDRLAYLLAHELSHITCKHVDRMHFGKLKTKDETLQLASSREDEFEADREGFKLLVKAGFSYSGAVEIFKKFREVTGDFSSIEANGVGHPSFTERASFVDNEKENIWRAMSSFSAGVNLLDFEQYEAASICFEKVKDEFPDSYEAHANLGYAMLMRYFDALDLEDLKSFNIGQIVIGGFYRRPASLEEKIRGINEELWWKAVGYFKDALRINPNLSLVKANLGIAYLLDPRQKSRGEAQKYFSEALEEVEKDATIDPLQKAIVYVNAGNLFSANNSYASATDNLNRALQLIENADEEKHFFKRSKNTVRGLSFNKEQISSAIAFNKYWIETKNFSVINDKKKTEAFLLDYLKTSDRSSIWWMYCYDTYKNVCTENGIIPIAETKIKTTKSFPIPKSIILQDGASIFLSQKISEVNSKINYTEKIPIVAERKFYKYIYKDLGFEIVGGESVLEIVIRDLKKAADLKIQLFGSNESDYSYSGLVRRN